MNDFNEKTNYIKEFVVDIWEDEDTRNGIIASIISMFICLFIAFMFGAQLFKPSFETGVSWTLSVIVTFFVFMGFSNRIT